jgi:hypothetical protein
VSIWSSPWAVAIIGGKIASVIAGVVVLEIANSQPSHPQPHPTARSAGSGALATSSPLTTPSQSSLASPAVFYTGQRSLSSGYYADLDNPSWAVSQSASSGSDIDLGAFAPASLESVYGDWGILSTPGASGYAACADFTAFSPVPVAASGLPPGTRICVKTTEGALVF